MTWSGIDWGAPVTVGMLVAVVATLEAVIFFLLGRISAGLESARDMRYMRGDVREESFQSLMRGDGI